MAVNLEHMRVKTELQRLQELIFLERIPMNDFLYCETGYKKGDKPPVPDSTWGTLNHLDPLGGKDKHFWIHKTFKTPSKNNPNSRIYFQLFTGREGQWDACNPQIMVYLNGDPVQGMDINHTDIALDFDTEYTLQMYLYAGNYILDFPFMPRLAILDSAVEKLWYDMKVPYDCLACLNEKDENAVMILKHLHQACNILDLRNPHSDAFYQSVSDAEKFMNEEFYGKVCGNSNCEVSCIGHTHIDIAWLWTIAITEEKAQRSFLTMLNLMDEYDDFVFMSSQPQLYEYVKELAPDIYERVKKRVEEGRWEVEGAMWLEADCNLSSGESLIRQVMTGKKFFKDEFGVDSKILWLPDVFGYSAALPQILKKCGVNKFVTSKISWNDTNRLPYDVFLWEGLDGTEIFTTFITAQKYEPGKDETACGYSNELDPATVVGTRQRFTQKDFSNRALLTFGFADGGGGPTRTMMENHRRLKHGIPGIPKTVVEPVSSYLDKLEGDFMKSAKALRKLPRWVGELYLEFHRGTYTSQAKNKKFNRDCEFLLQTTEQLSVGANLLTGHMYPQDELNKNWKTVLLNQFHDIIPGSSIPEVYEQSDKEYAEVLKSGDLLKQSVLLSLASKIVASEGTVIYNPNSFPASGPVVIDGKTVFVEDVPPMGYKTVAVPSSQNNMTVTPETMENQFYCIHLDQNGELISIYDKENNREIIAPGETANRFEVFEDLPYEHDNWEIPSYHKQKKWNVSELSSMEAFQDGARSGLRITRPFLNSTIKQEICIYENSRRIDFNTTIDWKEEHLVLKTAFPLNLHSFKATYETQFGYLERPTHENTPWDAAKFEVCAHKYADISEDDYGVAILNNCKYGYSAEGSTLNLTLLKCGTYPDPNADKTIHNFTYSLFPHAGNHRQGGVVQEAYLLNRPLLTCPATGDGSLANQFSLLKHTCENVIIETVKKAEDNNNIILRAYDAYNRKCTETLSFGFNAKKAWLCDMLENPIEELAVNDNTVSIPIANFEIVTLMIEPE